MLDLRNYIPANTDRATWLDETCQAVLDPKVRDAFRDATGITLSRPSMVVDALSGQPGYDAEIVHAFLMYLKDAAEPHVAEEELPVVKCERRGRGFRRAGSTLTTYTRLTAKKPINRVSKKHKDNQAEWARITKIVIDMAQGRCRINSPVCTGEATCAHHRKRRTGAASNTLANAVASCGLCNTWLESNSGYAYAKGYKVRINGDPIAKFFDAHAVSESQEGAREVSQNIVTGATPQRRTGTTPSDLNGSDGASRRSA